MSVGHTRNISTKAVLAILAIITIGSLSALSIVLSYPLDTTTSVVTSTAVSTQTVTAITTKTVLPTITQTQSCPFESAGKCYPIPSWLSSYPGYCSSAGECSVGVADYGIWALSSQNETYYQTYSYDPVAIEANTTFNELDLTTGIILPNVGATTYAMSNQLNAVVVSQQANNTTQDYWIQNVATISNTPPLADFEDWIWNLTTPTAVFEQYPIGCPNATGVSGNLKGVYSCPQLQNFYNLQYPFKIVMTEAIDQQQQNCVQFGYSVYNATHVAGSGIYDTVCFPSSKGLSIEVGGGPLWNGSRLPDKEIENVLGGPGGGANINILNINASVQLYYKSAADGSWTSVPHAWSVGQTAETATNAVIFTSYANDLTSTFSAEVVKGTGSPHELW